MYLCIKISFIKYTTVVVIACVVLTIIPTVCYGTSFLHTALALCRLSTCRWKKSGSESSFQSGNEVIKGCDLNKPEYTLEEVNNMELINESDGTGKSSDNKVDSNRLEHLHWCLCEGCIIF